MHIRGTPDPPDPPRAGSDHRIRSARILSETLTADIRVSDLPDPRPGDLIVIGTESFAIQGEPIRDRDRLIWTVELVPA